MLSFGAGWPESFKTDTPVSRSSLNWSLKEILINRRQGGRVRKIPINYYNQDGKYNEKKYFFSNLKIFHSIWLRLRVPCPDGKCLWWAVKGTQIGFHFTGNPIVTNSVNNVFIIQQIFFKSKFLERDPILMNI